MDDKSLIRRYQLEIVDLKCQLEVLTMQSEHSEQYHFVTH